MRLTHLQCLEAESTHLMQDVVAEAKRPVLMYSIGKGSAVVLYLARKAFNPGTATVPASACGYHLEVARHVFHARQHC